MIKLVLFLLIIGNTIYAQSRRIYVQNGHGYLKDTAPLISPGVGLATILSQPLLSEKQIQLLPIAIERNFKYRTEHTTIGF